MFCMSSGSCEPPDKELDAGEIVSGFGMGDSVLEISGEATIAIESSQGPLDHPAPEQDLEAGGAITAT